MVEGAAFFLLCHDDVALDPTAVHQLVEEAFRSNAGVVSPKFVNWDDPAILLHVGMSCDKTGAVVDRIVEGEVDHGQHDAVRDVFVAPGGCILVRADLFRILKGFDAGIVAMGEDLDLSWRSQVAGSRVVVAPEARVRHREAVAGGTRAAGGPAPRPRAATPSPCRCCSGATSCGPSSSATPGSTWCGCCRRRRCWRWGRSSSPRSPATATGCGPSPAPGGGTPGACARSRCCAASWPHSACSPTPRSAVSRCGAARACRATSAA